jgi:hypothetical protein
MEEIDLNPTDTAILEMLREGRCSPTYIAEEKEYSRQNVTNRLGRLVEHGYVRKLAPGLYTLEEDPSGLAANQENEGAELEFTPIDAKNVSYGPSSRDGASYVLRVGTDDGAVKIHLDEDDMYALWTEVQHTPWPERREEQEEAGRLRSHLVELAMGADIETLRAALEAMDDRPPGEREWE